MFFSNSNNIAAYITFFKPVLLYAEIDNANSISC
jgi:hypothetical protein